MESKLKIYDTAKRKKTEFTPLNPPLVKMYCCGPTVYDLLHIGNFRGAIFYNSLRNWLECCGYKVEYVYNFTDVDDKILNRAKEQGIKPKDLANKFIEEFKKDYQSLGLKMPTRTPKATEVIADIIQLVEQLIQKSRAYENNGDVFYSVKSFPPYGHLSGRNTDELIAGARVEPNKNKQDPLDFALWKKAKPEEAWSWDSPWGPGRPGWHIECTTMIHKYLGSEIDIHGGGTDLIFPHHENEIAQSEGLTGGSYARYWIHNGMIAVESVKMSKSLGNLISLREFLSQYPAEVFKYLILSSHYRSIVNFSPKTVRQSLVSLARLYSGLAKAQRMTSQSQIKKPLPDFQNILQQKEKAITEAFNEDFATPKVFALFFDLLKAFNEISENTSNQEKAWAASEFLRFFKKYGEILSLFQETPPEKFLKNLDEHILKSKNLSRQHIKDMVKKRESLREEKNFKEADRLRDELEALGISLQDSASGTQWEVRK